MIAPTIIIGLGGVGSNICCRVSRLVKDESQRRRLRCVCIDTDINDLRQRKEEDPRIITIQTSAPYTVGNYLKINTYAREEWFPVHNILKGKTPTEGAGQVRAISRLAFDTAVREGAMSELDKAIEELYYLDGAAEPQAIRVMIVSTLAGGTGSGIVLPVALYVRHFLETRFQKNASVVRGFFLLPEIMFGNKSPEECGSLCCNAYASMRELDAFIRRGNGALPSKYGNLRVMMPDSTTSNYVDYSVTPFNFCFLYDKRNTDDLQLISFVDYEEHAANTIYTQTMSGISSRSNSNEDNAIKALVSSQGRNCFCGAGSSLMKYPRDSVLDFVASSWAVESMSTDWLKVDRDFRKEEKNQKILRKKNPSLKVITRQEFYLNAIEKAEEGTFEEYIKDMCFDVSEGEEGLVGISKVTKYLASLNAYIDAQISKDIEVQEAESELAPLLYQLEAALSNKKDTTTEDSEEKIKDRDFADKLIAAGNSCLNYALCARRIAERVGRSLALQLFQMDGDFTEDMSKPYRMEYYLRDEDGRFVHPNAVRYFIYSLQQILTRSCAQLNAKNGTLEQGYHNAIEPFDDQKTANKTEHVEDSVIKNKVGKRLLFIYTDKRGRKKVFKVIQDQRESVAGYARAVAQKTIFEAAVVFLDKLSAAFETFYNNFEFYLEDTRNAAAEIQRKYINGEGKATRYVCASETCLKKMLEDMPSSGGDINGPLCATIFQEMKIYAMMVKPPKASTYFSSLFKDKIMGFWRDSVENEYGERINMDIISALMAEAEYESEDGLTVQQQELYAAKVLEQAERLAAPFIEEPMGEVRHPFRICAYNPEISGAADSTRRTFVNKYITGGQPDDNVSRYELMVYRAVYNISAGDLKRFRGPDEMDEHGGIYYAAYVEAINKLGPDTGSNKVITPHLDRHWHLTKYLPDMDDRNQKIFEDKIYTALAWSMITGRIKQNPYINSSNGREGVRYTPLTRGAEMFVVPNGSPCDELYEVVDALEINPPQVTLLLNEMSETLKREKYARLDLRETKLINCMNWDDPERALGGTSEIDTERIVNHEQFVLKQYAKEQAASIFDLLYWIKYSTPANDFDEYIIFAILDNMLTMLENHVKQFYDEEAAAYERCYEMLKDQFKLFLKNLKDKSVIRPVASKRFADPLIERIAVAVDDRIRDLYRLDPSFDDAMTGMYEEERKATV